MRLLAVIFCYERPALLKNTVESFFAFGPECDLLIIDDGSSNTDVKKYLTELKSRPRTAVMIRDRSDTSTHGGLYNNMTLATKHAINKDYSHIFFLQDDVQFMWKDPDFLTRVQHVFDTKPDASMVNCFFQKGIIQRQTRKRLIPHEDVNAWHLTPYAVADIGIMPVALLKEKNWEFGASEGGNNKVWYDWGYRLYALAAPTLAFIPWPPVDVHGKRYGKARSTTQSYLLHPLKPDQIQRLQAMPLSQIPYHEDFCIPWGWKCISPYWFTKFSWKHYLRYLRKCMKDGTFWPKIVGKM